MVWFISWAPDWSPTTNYLQHSYIHWMTRSVFSGKRKVHLNTQIDDVHLNTDPVQAPMAPISSAASVTSRLM